MKTSLKLTVCLAAGLFLGALFAWAQSPTEIIKTVASTSVPELLGTDVRAKTFIFIGMKAARTNNTSQVWIQRNPTNTSGGIPLLPGQIIAVTVTQSGLPITDWWIDVETAGDGVVCLLLQ